ncbi:hypothetical protein FRB91_006869 [Serendipita sp. 411]|nr:hypothetical protein FRB91_006869 [Serendipita sp. 411]
MLVNSGWTTSPALLPGLPVELWEVIIEFSFDIPEYFGDDCQPKDLPYFLDHRRVISPSSWKLDPYRRLEQHRFRLRLVSRTWNNIVELNSKQWRRSLDSKNLSRYQRVDITLPKNPKTRRPAYNEGLSFSSTPTLKILAIKELSSRINVVEQRISTLCHNPTEFLGNVKSLAYLASEARLSPSTISKLLSSFTSITVLILNSHRVEGALSLPQMHTLELSAEVYDLHDWKCPRLQHLSLLRRSNDDLLDEIIPNQFNSLRALMVLPLTAQLDTEFWMNYPKLQLFGCSDMMLVNRPPSDHPLKHIYINDNVYQMSPEQLSSILDCLGGGDRTLYITPPNFSRDGQRKWNQWCQFYERCQINGIAWRSILPNDDPDVAWLPLIRIGWVDRLERIAVSWTLEINISASLAIICCVKDAAVVFRDLRLLFSAFVIYGLVHFTCSDILVSI